MAKRDRSTKAQTKPFVKTKRPLRPYGPLMKRYVRLRCRKHPRYRGIREQEKNICPSCQLILILVNQHRPDSGGVVLGLPNPYQHIPDLREALEGLEAIPDKHVVHIGFV